MQNKREMEIMINEAFDFTRTEIQIEREVFNRLKSEMKDEKERRHFAWLICALNPKELSQVAEALQDAMIFKIGKSRYKPFLMKYPKYIAYFENCWKNRETCNQCWIGRHP
jgi:hypothetical protein